MRVKATLFIASGAKRGEGAYLGGGLTRKNTVHVKDTLFLAILIIFDFYSYTFNDNPTRHGQLWATHQEA